MKKKIQLTEEDLKKVIKKMIFEEYGSQYGVDYREITSEVWTNLTEFLGDDCEKWKEVCESLLHWLDDKEVEEWAVRNDYLAHYTDEEESDEYDNNENIYSMSDWQRDGSLKLQTGQYISEKVFERLLNDMPPAKYTKTIFQPGEPVSHKDGKPLYHTFVKNGGNLLWQYRGLAFTNN